MDGAVYDVIVVGAGNAGLCAALSAHQMGTKVLLLDKCPKSSRGGNTRLGSRAAREQYLDLRLTLPQYAQAIARRRRGGLRGRQIALSLLPVLERGTVHLIGGMAALFVGEREFQLCLCGQKIALAL